MNAGIGDVNETPKAPAPWGSPPTPLLPRWYIETLALTPLPPALVRAGDADDESGVRMRTVGDLPTFWGRRSTPIDGSLRRLLINLVQHHRPPGDYVVIPQGVDLARLLLCPLRTRTENCLKRVFVGHVLHGKDRATTVAELLALPNFGITALLDLMCITEAGLENSYLTVSGPATAHRPPVTSTDGPSAPDENPAAAPPLSSQDGDRTADAWNSANRLLKKLFRAAQEFRGASTLEDALAGDLVGLVATLGMSDDLRDFPISDLVIGPTLAEEAVLGIVGWRECESLSPVERLILERRILTREPAPLEAISHTTEFSRERIRQLEKPLRSAFEATVDRPIKVIAACVGEQLDPVLAEDDLDASILSTFPSTISPDTTAEATDTARHLLRTHLGYSCVDRICLSREATAVVEELQAAARSLADDAGLVNEADLRAHLPDGWEQNWDALVSRASLHRFSGRLALRGTAKARAKAALLEIGHPATKEEVARLSGLAPDRASAQLSSLSSVVRADKVRWGLADWVEDEYEGIPAEIVQRINEDGGSTRLDRLLDEIPRRFGVSESSVKAYVETPAFRVDHGWVSHARDPTLPIGGFVDVASGRDRNSDPYWVFPMHQRYLRGYSITGFPPELAGDLGCRIGQSTTVAVRAPSGVRDISLIWRATSIQGPEIGRVAEALTAIAANEADHIRLILHADTTISFELHSLPQAPRGLASGEPPSPVREVTATNLGSASGVRIAEPVRGRLRINSKVAPARRSRSSYSTRDSSVR